MEIETTVREWGRSLGIIIPSDSAKKDNLKPGDKVNVIVLKNGKDVFLKTFGKLKDWKRPTDEILSHIDKELWQ